MGYHSFPHNDVAGSRIYEQFLRMLETANRNAGENEQGCYGE